MNIISFIFIVFLYYGGVETVSEICEIEDFKEAFKIALILVFSALGTGFIYYLFGRNINFSVKFMALPLTFVFVGHVLANLFFIKPSKIIFSSFPMVLFFLLPENGGSFFVGLLAGCLGFIFSLYIIYRFVNNSSFKSRKSLTVVLIITSIISMVLELF